MHMSVQIQLCNFTVCLTVSAAHTACADLADVQNIVDKVCCHGKTIKHQQNCPGVAVGHLLQY